MTTENKLYCELSLWERMKENYKENSMLGKFYSWLNKKRKNKSEISKN
jgi:hypothetical protein